MPATSTSTQRVRARFFFWLFLLASTSLSSAQTTHKVLSGETLDSIGRQHNVTPNSIAAFNNLSNPNLIVPGTVLNIPPKPGSTITYKVQAGDTLGGIASMYGTTVAAIIETNSFSNPDSLKVGQSILVPAKTIPGTCDRYPLPASLKKQLDATPVSSSRWKYIVIHHSATKNGTIKGMDDYHRKNRHMENGLAYHFVIGNGNGIPNGSIEIGNRWKRQIRGGHLASEAQNQVAIGICLIGNFEISNPTAAQMNSLYALVSYLQNRCRISTVNVKPHTQINKKPTKCPGKNFPTSAFLRNL